MNWKKFDKHFEPQRIFAYSGLILVVTIIILAIVNYLEKA